VSTSKYFTPSYEDAYYREFIIFMPYEELHLSDYGQHNLAVDVGFFRIYNDGTYKQLQNMYGAMKEFTYKN
jgi:hypothetical protein